MTGGAAVAFLPPAAVTVTVVGGNALLTVQGVTEGEPSAMKAAKVVKTNITKPYKRPSNATTPALITSNRGGAYERFTSASGKWGDSTNFTLGNITSKNLVSMAVSYNYDATTKRLNNGNVSLPRNQ